MKHFRSVPSAQPLAIATSLNTEEYPQWFTGRIAEISRNLDYAFIDLPSVRREDGSPELGIPADQDLMLHVKENRPLELSMQEGDLVRFRVAPGNHPRRTNKLVVHDAALLY